MHFMLPAGWVEKLQRKDQQLLGGSATIRETDGKSNPFGESTSDAKALHSADGAQLQKDPAEEGLVAFRFEGQNFIHTASQTLPALKFELWLDRYRPS